MTPDANRSAPEDRHGYSRSADHFGSSGNRGATLLTEVNSFLSRMEQIRRQFHLDPDELLILLTIGQLCLSMSTIGLTVRPVKCIDIANKLKIPKETARRKLYALSTRDFVIMTKSGATVKNIDEWVSIARSIAS
jgi:hypothetical protein